jgi:hypothetical protein
VGRQWAQAALFCTARSDRVRGITTSCPLVLLAQCLWCGWVTLAVTFRDDMDLNCHLPLIAATERHDVPLLLFSYHLALDRHCTFSWLLSPLTCKGTDIWMTPSVLVIQSLCKSLVQVRPLYTQLA